MPTPLAPAVRRELRARLGTIEAVNETEQGLATATWRVEAGGDVYAVKRPRRPADAGAVLVAGRVLEHLDGGPPRTPTPVAVREDPPLLVTEWCEGRQFRSLSPDGRRRATRGLGRAVATLHDRHPMDAVGAFDPAASGWPGVDATPLADWLGAQCRHVLADAPDWAVAALEAPVERACRRWSFEEPGRAALVQGDVVRSNAVFGADGGLRCLLDFEAAAAAPPACERLAAAEKLRYWSPVGTAEYPFSRGFLAGYRDGRTPTEPPSGRASAFRLLGLLKAVRARGVVEREHERRHTQLLRRARALLDGY